MLAVAAIFASVLVAPSSALAHASLRDTTPVRDAVLERAPAQVVLRFDEAVSTVVGSVRVFDSAVRRVDSGDVRKPTSESVSVSLPTDLPHGTYVVAWRVISPDSHPIRGAFAYSIGEPVEDTTDIVKAVLDQEAGSESVDLALAVIRYAGFALILLCVGGAAVLAFAVEPRELRGSWHWLVLASAGALLAVDSVVWIALTGVKAAGFGLSEAFRWSLFREVVETGFGQVWVARAVLALAVSAMAIVALRRRSSWWPVPLLLVTSAIAVTPALSGHARVEGSLAVLSDSVHVVAAGVWVGGLAFLALVLVEEGGDRWSLATNAVPRFSMLAVASVVALVGSGVLNGILEVRSWQGLWDTTYGRLLLVKVGILLPLLAVGAFNNRVSVPRLRAGKVSPRARLRFARAVGLELALMLVVLGVTTALVAEPPAKAHAAAAAGPVTREGQIGPYEYTVTVDPAVVGSNVVHVYVLDSTGQLAVLDEIGLSGTLPSVDVGPLAFETTPAGPGHAVATAGLPLAGDWRLELDVRKGEFDEWRAGFEIPIRKV
jgi:copper transport protein